MSRAEREVMTTVADMLRREARQATWTHDPVGWAKDTLGVHMWSKQREIAESVVHNKRTVVASCHGTGKALAVETPIPTPGGWTTMGDITPGTQVLGSTGQPVNVIATTGIHTADRYRITLTRNGTRTEITASGDHIWSVLSPRDVAMASVLCDRSSVLLHTGLWHHRAKNVTTRDIVSLARRQGRMVIPAVTPRVPARGRWWEPEEHTAAIIRRKAVAGIWGRAALSWETPDHVHPPDELMLVRADLLAQKVPSVRHRRRIRSAAEWTLHIGGDRVIDLLRSPDDQALVSSLCVGGSDPGWTIESILRIDDGLVQCIQVDAPDSLYLCGTEMVPTHNSMIASVIACWWVSTRPVGEAIVVSCYTDDTEVLTKEGWKFFKDVTSGPDGDEFATRNPETKEFEWQRAFRYYEAPWDGEVIDVRGRSLDLRVTPNHRMAVQWSTYQDGVKTVGETFKRADAIGPRGAELPALSAWDGKTPETVTFGSYTWDTLDFAAFLGAWIAEGSLGPRRTYIKKGGYGGSVEGDVSSYSGSIVLTQIPGTKGYEPYRDLLTRMLGREPCRSSGKDWVFSCSDLYEYLSNLGSAHEKYIPVDVKNWGRDALEKFLEFYLLGDGWFQKSPGRRASSGYGSWRSCTVSKRLADDLQEIAQKVGRHATITAREPRNGGTFEGGRKILKENCRTGYYLIFGDAQTRSVKTSRSHYQGNVYCVSVPNETLYVRRGGSPIWCGNTAPTYSQVNKILWEEIRSHHRKAALRDNPLPGRVTQGDEWKSDDGTVMAFGRKPPDGDRHAFHGIHRRYVLVVIDEACGVPEEIWTGAEAITTSDACRIIAIGNPDDRQTEFGKAFLDPATAQDWNRISVPASVTPNFTGEPVPRILNEVLVSQSWCEERLRSWGKDDPRYISKVLAKFPEQSKSSLFSPNTIATATDEVDPQTFGGVLRLGVDVARFGTDNNVVVSYLGNTAKVEKTWAGVDTVSSAHEVIRIAESIKEERGCSWVEIRVDAVGLGAGVVDTLNARSVLEKTPWFSVYEMHGSASPPVNVGGSVHGYGNARAYWFDQLRQAMRNRSVQIEPDQRVTDDLAIVFYKFKSGKLFILSKEEMRKIHGRSPDFADALAYATAPIVDELPPGMGVSQDAGEAMEDFMDGLDDSELSIAPY